ncbi:MAG: DUF2314 domain-containing protein [Myxococcaceae bacterium]|nr:DUF2314 domain-containing protein [Myxococcaceae bacterium]
MRDLYLLATASTEPVDEAALKEAFEAEDVALVFGEDGCLFSLRAEDSRVDVTFETRSQKLGWTPDLLTGTEASQAALRSARGFYRVAFEPGKPQGSVAVFEALWCVRTLMEHVEGVVVDVSAFKIHSAEDIEEITELEFDIRDHITLHAVEASETSTPMWVHTHGMAKFGMLDVEMFSLSAEDLQPAETFLHELCTDMAFDHGPAWRTAVSTSVGMSFQVMPSDEARPSLYGVAPEQFEGHESGYLTVTSPEGRHSLTEVLKQYRDRFEAETPEEKDALASQAKALLPSFKARFLRRGLMEPLSFVVRAPFEVHPNGDEGEADEEQLWVEVVQWEEDTLIGKLVDGGERTTEWRRGAHVEIEQSQINALAVSRDGRTLDEEDLKNLLNAERPM